MKTVLITGGATGIGAQTAALFAENGYTVYAGYNNTPVQNIDIIPIKLDVTNSEQVDAAIDKIGTVDILINNAGIAQQKLFTDIAEDEWQNMMNIHLGGAFRLSKAALPAMIRQKSGVIINISSIWGMVGASCEVHYSTAKAGLIGMTKALAKEVAPSSIRVNCVAPGVVDTKMSAALSETDKAALCEDILLGRMATSREIASSIFYLASDDASYITGQVLSPNGGWVI